MRSPLLFALLFLLGGSLSAQQVILTGIIDGTSSGSPRAVELYVSGTVDLSGYALERYANGATSTNGAEQALSGTYTDAFVYVINNQHDAAFTSAFGNSGDFANRIPSNIISGNGNDAFALVQNGTIIDLVGNALGDAGNTYRDSWLYRNDNTGPDGGWVPANWSPTNNDALDGQSFAQMGALVPFGTYMTTPPGPGVTVTGATDATEDGTQGTFVIALSETSTTDVTVGYSFSGTATQNLDYFDSNSGSITIPAGMTSRTIIITPVDDSQSEPTESIVLTVNTVSDATFSTGASDEIGLIDNEPVSAINISAVQGSGTSSPLVGQTITVEGIVVGDFQGGSGVGLGGFFIQEEDADSDLDPATSDGVWVFDNSASIDVAEGDLVTVTGLVEEQNDLTQINATAGTGAGVVIVSSNNTLPTAAQLDLPVSAESDYEALEGMLTTVIDDLTVTETFGIGRFGEFDAVEGDRLIQFTECNESDPAALAAYNTAQDLRRLTVDDGRSGDNAFPIVLGDGMEVNANNTLRAGTIITNLTGVVDERFTGYRFQATGFGRTDANPRPTAAPSVGGNLTVVGMNVLNYFTTLGSRGADNQTEFDRQEAKIVNAIIELDADILGLVEIENDGFGANSTIQTLIDAITAAGGPTYTAVVNSNPGTDQIQVSLIYKADVVEESGTAANLATPSDVFSSNRIPLAQTFRVVAADNPNVGQEITVCVNHWKSKGGSCGAGDDDNGGAGSCNGTRDAAAQAIVAWLATNPTGVNEPDQLIIGDLNAYSEEDPLLTLEAAGFVNMVRALADPGSFPCGSVPSYVFRGEWGSLDHAFASASLSTLITGALPWEVNAAEPPVLDYDTQFNNPALYADDFYRFSDHNPIVIGVDLGATLPAELMVFTGRENKGKTDLRWATAAETNTDRFAVQRRDNSGRFVTIGTVRAAGNSTTSRAYAFTDDNPFSGTNFYRLQTVDQDGSTVLSNVITVSTGTDLRLAPTGFNTYRLSGVTPGAAYALTDAGGAVVRSGSVISDTQLIDGQDLPAGLYFLVVGGERAKTFKLILR